MKERERNIPTVFFPDRQTVKDSRLSLFPSPEDSLFSPLSIPSQCSLCLARISFAVAGAHFLWFHPLDSGHLLSTHSAWLRVSFFTLDPGGRSKVVRRMAPGMGVWALVEAARDP